MSSGKSNTRANARAFWTLPRPTAITFTPLHITLNPHCNIQHWSPWPDAVLHTGMSIMHCVQEHVSTLMLWSEMAHLACSSGSFFFSFCASSQLLKSAKWVKKMMAHRLLGTAWDKHTNVGSHVMIYMNMLA